MLFGLRGEKKQQNMDPNIWINALTCAFTLGVVIISAITAKKAVQSSQELAKKQMQISVFAECTRRFQEIKLHLKKGELDKEYYQRLYIDLCSEEFYLHSKGYITDDVWVIWVKGMNVTVDDDSSYSDIWKTDIDFYDDNFRHFFNNLIIKPRKH